MSDSLIPVTRLTGFPGSGKTRVLNHLVCQPALARTLFIINEFGAVGLDHLLVSRMASDTVMELASDCLCCTVRGDLINALKDAHWRFARGGERRCDRVSIETTGLADTAPTIHTLMRVGVIIRRYRVDGVVATLDLTNADQTRSARLLVAAVSRRCRCSPSRLPAARCAADTRPSIPATPAPGPRATSVSPAVAR